MNLFPSFSVNFLLQKKIEAYVFVFPSFLGTFRTSAKSYYQLRHICPSIFPSFLLSVRPFGWNNSVPTRQILIKFDICVFSENLSRKFKFH